MVKITLVLPLLCLVAAASFGANDVRISEFMASNDLTYKDEDNQYSDWVELQNLTGTNINLGGWYLTDNAGNKTKWKFPATNIVANGFMVVFCDGKDRKVAGAPLHTSFSLGAEPPGEYLALVRPDLSIATEFQPVTHYTDVSYGFGLFSTNTTLVSTSAQVRVRIPANDADGTNWTLLGYDDSAWTLGTNGVGYGSTNVAAPDYSAAVLPMQPVVYWRMSEASGTVATNLGSQGANGTYGGTLTLGTPGPRPPTWGGFEPNNLAPTFSMGYATANSSLLSGQGQFTMAGWVYFTAAPTNRTGLFGQNDAVEFGFSAPANLQCWTPGGAVNIAWTPPLNTWVHVLAQCDGATIRVYTNAVLAGSGAGLAGSSASPFNVAGNGIFDVASIGNWFTGLMDEVVLFHRNLSSTEVTALYQAGVTPAGVPTVAYAKTDVGPVMSNINASAQIRLPFTVSDTNQLAQLTLRMRYDDGFVAYINGTEVVRANAADPLVYNSTATSAHGAATVEEYRFSSFMVTNGVNVLAIQGLNVAANDPDFLVAAELIGTSPALESTNATYLFPATPNAANANAVANPGPSIFEIVHTPNVPLDNDDLLVTARIVSTFNAVSNAVLRYKIMFDNEIEVPMFDDGLHGDGATNDGIFAASIPASASTNGQMIRWYIRAKDVTGNTSRWPMFRTVDSAEFLGTVVNPGYVTSKLPIMHLFAPTNILSPVPAPVGSADTQTGGRVALFYDGEFYDNIEFNLRGNTTAGFAKKSHHVNFNAEHPFRNPSTSMLISHTSFVADYPDPTYMRQGLSFWLCDQMGAPAPFYDPVRLQLNGQFYQLANHSDTQSADHLERLGYDPEGALYKAHGMITYPVSSTGQPEKKTRLYESNADYMALATGIAETNALATRKTNAFETLDIPEVLNYLVSARWVHENDDVWANMSMYRDTRGDQRWRIIPFDMNLSWGAIYYENVATCGPYVEGVQATNDPHKAFPLYGSSQALPCGSGNYNRIYDTFFQVPELRQMYLRRLRTLMDTWIKPIGTPTNSTYLEQYIIARRDLIAEEANRDRAKWGWPAKSGQCNFDPGIDLTNGVDRLLTQFLGPRRTHFYGKHSVTNTGLAIGLASSQNAGIPNAQPAVVNIGIAGFDYNPSSGNQGHEYIQLTNGNSFAVDMSGWELDGAVEFTFKPGTVMSSNSVLYITPDLVAFKTRTTTPKAGQGLFVLGNYKGQLSARGETIKLYDTSGRLVATNIYAPNPTLAQQYLRITEIMYHPGPTNGNALYPREDYEYIELKNIGPTSLNLVGVHFTNGIDFSFATNSPVTNLTAGQTIVLVKNPSAFIARHGGTATIAGTYVGSLDNAGERIQLHDAVGEEVLDFSYNNSWYPITDGLGFSLVIVDPNGPFQLWDEKQGWRASGTVNGSPGTTDPAPGQFAPVLVNEVMANSVAPTVDTIELWNSGTNPASIAGWYISDDFYTPKKYRITNSTPIPAGGYVTFTEAQFNPNPGVAPSFAFSSKSDEAYVFAADGAGNLLGYYHGFHFGASAENVTFGRYVTSDGEEHFVAQAANTLGSANSAPLVGPVVISEIMYHPPEVDGTDNAADEFIELHNFGNTPAPLYDVLYPTNTWILKDAVDFTFATNTSIPAGGYLLVTSFDPSTNAPALAAFRSRYNLSPAVPIVGPYQGKLDNSEDNVELSKPQTPDTNGVEYILVDKVDYKDLAPWSTAADGFGPSLQRIVVSSFGNDSTNWISALASPGTNTPAGSLPVITMQISNAVVLGGTGTNFTIAATGGNLRYQWRFNGTNLLNGTNATLVLTNIQSWQAGDYNVAVFNEAGAVVSTTAVLSVNSPVQIVVQPLTQNVPPGSNTTMSVSVVGTGTVRYQWRFNNTNIVNATNASYAITNAELYAHSGVYTVQITDDVSTVTSAPATLYLNVRPIIVQAPQPTTVLQGGTAAFWVIAGPVHPLVNITYRWVRQLNTNTTSTNNLPVYYIYDCSNTGRVVCAVTALSGSSSLLSNSPFASLTVLADNDHDGMGDLWEIANGFATNNAGDATLDSDNDKMINRDEYVAGTNPNDASSLLRLDSDPLNPAVLQFTAQSNISYTVQYRTNLTTAPWQASTNVPASPAPPHLVPFTAVTNDTRFYRVVTPQAVPY